MTLKKQNDLAFSASEIRTKTSRFRTTKKSENGTLRRPDFGAFRF